MTLPGTIMSLLLDGKGSALGCYSLLSSLALLASVWDEPYCLRQLYSPLSLLATLISALVQKTQSSLANLCRPFLQPSSGLTKNVVLT